MASVDDKENIFKEGDILDQDDLQLVSRSIRIYVDEYDGEFPYWGDRLMVSPPTPPVNRQIQSSGKPSKSEQLLALRNETIGDCQRCPLSQSRINIVFGVGNPDAQVMFIGEGPGFDEDRQGEPFVGKAGQLLDRIMGSIGLDRTNVYIANIVKCHPMIDPSQPEKRGNDRPPTPEEAAQCVSFLMSQIRIVQPRIVVTLGAVATRILLNTAEGISKIRGQVRTLSIGSGIPDIAVLPTFHPAALLRNPDLKREVWTDMKQLRQMLS